MHEKDVIRTEQNATFRRIDVTDEVIIKEFNCIEQIYKRFQVTFA